MAKTYLGIGYPFRRGKTATPAPATDDQVLADSLAQIVMTARGERVMRDSFGTRTTQSVFEQNQPVTAAVIQGDVMQAIRINEPRVEVREVRVTLKNDGGATQSMPGMAVSIRFVSKLTGAEATVEANLG